MPSGASRVVACFKVWSNFSTALKVTQSALGKLGLAATASARSVLTSTLASTFVNVRVLIISRRNAAFLWLDSIMVRRIPVA